MTTEPQALGAYHSRRVVLLRDAALHRGHPCSAGVVLVERSTELDQVGRATGELMPRAILRRFAGGAHRGRAPTRPGVQPGPRDRVPLIRRAVDADRRHAVRMQRVILALQAVAVLRRVAVPRVACLHVQPPSRGVDVEAVGVGEGIQSSVVAIIVSQAVVVPRRADLRAVGVDVGRLAVPARIDVKAEVGEPGGFLRQTGTLTIAGPIAHADNAERRMRWRRRRAVRPGDIIAGRAAGIGRRCRRVRWL